MLGREQEIITIPCPLCAEKHSYTLTVNRVQICADRALPEAADQAESDSWQPHMKEFTRLFTCPTKNQGFQATFRLLEWPEEYVSVEDEKLLSTKESKAENGQNLQKPNAQKRRKHTGSANRSRLPA